MKVEKEEILLAKWLAGNLNESEKEYVQGLDNFAELKEALEMVGHFDTPKPNLKKIKLALDQKQTLKTIPTSNFKLWGSVAAAAIIGIVFWFFTSEKPIIHQTANAEHQQFTLPDNSQVILNAKSHIKYYQSAWKKDRILSLNGQAFFNVKKGSTFTVESPQGNVEVVGTQFDVLSREGLFEVFCQEGKVRVHTQSLDTLLVAGKGLFIDKNQTQYFDSKDSYSSWTERVLTFRQKKIAFIFEELERQFDLEIDFKKINKKEKFSGKVPLNNKKMALDIVCKTMTLKYDFLSEQKVVISK